MARQVNLYYRGRQGNLIYYKWKDIPCIRTVPARVRQTHATRLSAATFGVAVRCAKNIRQALEPLLPDSKDRNLINRLNTALYKWLQQAPADVTGNYAPIPALTGFSFNEHRSLSDRLKLSLHMDRQAGAVRITIPAINPVQHIVAPAGTLSVTLMLTALTCHVQTGTTIPVMTAPLTMSYTNTLLLAQMFTLPLTVEPGSISLVAARLRYHHAAGEINKMEWMPAGIISAVG